MRSITGRLRASTASRTGRWRERDGLPDPFFFGAWPMSTGMWMTSLPWSRPFPSCCRAFIRAPSCFCIAPPAPTPKFLDELLTKWESEGYPSARLGRTVRVAQNKKARRAFCTPCFLSLWRIKLISGSAFGAERKQQTNSLPEPAALWEVPICIDRLYREAWGTI